MSLNEWSESIVLAETGEEPTFSEDMTSLMAIVEDSEQGGRDMPDMVVNLADVDYLNSSNIAQLLRLRKKLNTAGRNMRICAVEDQVWGVLMITGLDKIFDFTDDVTTALASLQLTD